MKVAEDVGKALNKQPSNVRNRSLRYDKYEPSRLRNDSDNGLKDRIIEGLLETPEYLDGRRLRLRFNLELEQGARSVSRFRASLGARMMVNMAGSVLENAGLCLDRHFGMPYIPGTALKGVCRRGAALAEADKIDIDRVLGRIDPRPGDGWKGSVCILPAYPASGGALEKDVMTTHHQNYYRGGREFEHALDVENPIPVVFPAVSADTEFEFTITVLQGRGDGTDLALAREWLLRGIQELGVGAKTSAGYGWFDYDEVKEEQRIQEESEKRRAEAQKQEEVKREKARLKTMSPVEREIERIGGLLDEDFATLGKNIGAESPDTQRAFIRVLSSNKKKLKTWKKHKAVLVSEISAIADALGENLQ